MNTIMKISGPRRCGKTTAMVDYVMNYLYIWGNSKLNVEIVVMANHLATVDYIKDLLKQRMIFDDAVFTSSYWKIGNANFHFKTTRNILNFLPAAKNIDLFAIDEIGYVSSDIMKNIGLYGELMGTRLVVTEYDEN